MTATSIPGVRSWQRLALTNTLTKAIADRMLLVVVAGLAMGAMNLLMGPMYLALEDVLAEMISQMPEELFAIAGGVDMATATGWYTGEMYSILVPFVLMFVAASSAARAFGGEMEAGTLGLVMSTPTRRTRIAADKVVAMVFHVLVASGIIALLTYVGILLAGIDIGFEQVLAIHLMVTLLSVFVGGIAMVSSIISGRGVLAILVAMLAAVSMYAVSAFLPMAGNELINDLAWLSPWQHFIATDPMGSGVDWASATLLAILAVVPLVASVYLFKRRDVAA
ncbi:MAG: ABC transporter permease subunit [Candidatus Limnocylindrales bacterium]